MTAYAATTPSEVSASTAAQRVEILRSFVKNNSYGYSYFTTTGSACADASANHGCTKCLTSNLITTTWIKNSLALLPNSDALLPSPRWASPTEAASYGKIGVIEAPAYSCVGFAMIAHWFIYAQKSTDNIAGEHIATIDLSNRTSAKANLEKYARVGDLLVYRTAKTNGNYSHAAIYTGCSTSGITVLDSNWGGSSGPTCKMQEHTIPYSSYRYVEITRATNASKTVTYTITYNANGGTNAPASQTKTKDVALTLSNTKPTRTGYNFLGWATTSTASSAQYSSGSSYNANANVTLYAVWEAKTYAVRYDANGGTGAPATQNKVHDKALTLSTELPKYDGYVFKGWRDISPVEGTWTETKPSSGTYETGYLYYCYGYEHNNDMTFWYGADKSKVESGAKENLPSGTSYDANKLRYITYISSTNAGDSFKPANGGTFTANYTNSDGTTGTVQIKNTVMYYKAPVYKQDGVSTITYQPGDAYTDNRDVTLVAMWEENEPVTYTVTFNANGGTGAPDGQTGTAGSKLTLSTTIPTRTNAKFMSWQDQNGDTHQPGTEITVESNLTLKAIWALKFVEDGQYVRLDESSYAAPGCIVNVPVLINNFGNPTSVDLNATFIGHKDIGNHELSTEGAPEYVGYTPSSAIELREDGLLCVGTAQFKIPGSATLGERFLILITDVDLTITDQNGELQVIQNGINVWDGSEAVSDRLYHVYANTVPTYTIAYIANGGTGEPDSQTKSQGESVYLSTQIPTKEGYLFKGWRIGGILYAPGDEYTEDSDAWAFAVWEEKSSDSYTVSFNANGGSGTMNSVTGISGGYTLPANVFTAPEGKQFKGWATSPSGAVIPGTSYNVTANTTFYAVWEEIPTSGSTTLQIGKAVSVREKEVVIPISLTNNTGIASMNFKINYDKTRLHLIGFEDAQMTGWMVGVGSGEKAIWVDENGSNVNGDILSLKFMVLDTAEDGLAEITVTGMDVVNVDEEDVSVMVVSGGIEVISRIPGDTNDDGNVSAADVLRLKKYLAGMEVEINPSNTDVTGDGRVSAADLLRLKKYFAGMDVVLE